MPLTYLGDILTINFDKTITKNLQLQKFAVPLHRQRKDGTEEASWWQFFDNIDNRAEMWESAVLVRRRNACSEMLVAYG